MAEKQKPVKTIRVGSIQFAVWENKSAKGTFKSVTIDKSYTTDGKEFKRTKNLSPQDLSLVKIGIDEVLKYLYLKSDVILPESEDDF